MKRLLFLALCVQCFVAHAMDRTTTGHLLREAEEAYTSGEHRKALMLYDSVASEMTSAALLYNIGNCHFKLNDVPRAILHYERALRLAPGSADIEDNLELARKQVVDRVGQLPGLSLGSFWDRLRAGKDMDHWARWSIFASLLFFGLLSAAVLLRRPFLRQLCYGAAAVAAMGLALTLVLAAHRVDEVRNSGEAIIMQPRVDVLAEPRDAAKVLFVLHEGTKVDVLQERNGWQEIKLPNGSLGWLPSGMLETI